MAPSATLLDLPVELLLLILPHLDVVSFLNLTSTCKALHTPDIVHEPSYWSTVVRTTFRVPNQPVVERDGLRWQRLYRRMLTSSRVYTWGSNNTGCLGHDTSDAQHQTVIRVRGGPRIAVRSRLNSPWPEPMRIPDGTGVVADLQCGGWSTSMLTARGALYAVGVIDGMANQKPMLEPIALPYPPGFVSPRERYEPSTAIKQFSAGRSHILGLSDSGRIWSWNHAGRPALHVKFLHHDIVETGKASGRGVVRKVVAGWGKSAALVQGIGIVIWQPLERQRNDTSIEDAALVLDSAVVPNTAFTRSEKRFDRSRLDSTAVDLRTEVGEVCSVLILEDTVVFNTDLGKVFVCEGRWDNGMNQVTVPVEVPVPSDVEGAGSFATDVQGLFRSIAVFTQSGAVLTSNQDLLMDFLHGRLNGRSLFSRIPALQNKDVIQVAFGDYHFHALHAPGYITSYGHEPRRSGAFGLGSAVGEGRLRGLRHHGSGDARLVPHAYTEGRRVWFEREKRTWIDFLVSGGVDPAECMDRVRMAVGSNDIHCQGEVSEWIEQEGRDWETKLGLRGEDEDGFGAYFALSVAAAGWHSGALVLVNEGLAEKMRVACEVRDTTAADSTVPSKEDAESNADDTEASDSAPSLLDTVTSVVADYGRWFLGMPPYAANPPPAATDFGRRGEPSRQPTEYGASPRDGYEYIWTNDHFPRLVLSNGTEMPGTVPFDEWRYGRPEWDLDAGL